MYDKLASFVGAVPSDDTKQLIIELAKNFNTLFVLDNLETINTADIKDFIDEFSEYGKILITSRIGLGEMEHRYKLNGLNDNDVIEYLDVLLKLYGFECYFSDDDKRRLAIDELHSNPLAIKWFVRCLYNGQSEQDILQHKEDVITFCMANVYDKLSDDAHQVLNMLQIAGVQLSFPELMYYLEYTISDCTKIKYAINELGKCNFIDEEKFRREKSIAITAFANEFLRLHYSDLRHLIKHFKDLERKLAAFGQQLLIKKSEDKFDIKSIQYKNKAELVAALFLSKALEAATKDEAFESIKYAKELVPAYFENNLISAQIYEKESRLKALEEYELAIKYCKTSEEKVRVLIIYQDFLVRMNDYQKALDELEVAEKLNVSISEVKIQKAKVLSYIGQYDLAENTLNEISVENLSNQNINKIQTRRADILRRRSELIDIRETQRRLVILKDAYKCFEICANPDRLVFEYIAKILEDLSYLYLDNDALLFILDIVVSCYQNIKRTGHYKEFKKQINMRMPQIQNNDFKIKICKYILDYNEYLHLLTVNEAVIYNLKSGYGFCKNMDYPQGMYFSMKGLPQDINYGDILSFSAIFDSKGKLSIISPKKVGNIDARILQSQSDSFHKN